MSEIFTVKTTWNNTDLQLETGKLAKQAHGSVVVTFGQTTILCTAVIEKKEPEVSDFTDMTVFYQERFYAAGKIPGGFVKREGKPSDKETLISRIIDRSLRPIVKLENDQSLQVICTVLSYDGENMPDVAALIGATAAVKLAGIDCKTISGVRICLTSEDEWIINPKFSNIESMTCELFISGTSDVVTMIECDAFEKSKKQLLKAFKTASNSLATPIKAIQDLLNKVGVKSQEVKPIEVNKDIVALYKRLKKSKTYKDLVKAFSCTKKRDRYTAIALCEQKMIENFSKTVDEKLLKQAIVFLKNEIVREKITLHKTRIDGRRFDEIRNITCEARVLPRVHGSALFTRGETQVLSVVTLGSKNDMQMSEDITNLKSERFMLHYNFPSFSVGELSMPKGISRREIGHGNLAKKAILPIIPPADKTQTAIRVVAEVLECNGSSSMASVCASSLALMDAGVQIKKHVAGIAMGMIVHENDIIILSDIMGDEDHLGDMDFKLAGTLDGITAIQMDTKTEGVKYDVLNRILDQGIIGIKYIIAKMHKALISAREGVSADAPKRVSIKIEKENIRSLIGPGGKTIKEISSAAKAKIDIEDDGTININAATQADIDLAIQKINSVISPYRIGNSYDITVTKIAEFGVFVKLQDKAEGFIHVSDLSDTYIESIEKYITVGQEFTAKMIGFDRSGKIKLSLKNQSEQNKNEKEEEQIDPPTKVNAKKKRFF